MEIQREVNPAVASSATWDQVALERLQPVSAPRRPGLPNSQRLSLKCLTPSTLCSFISSLAHVAINLKLGVAQLKLQRTRVREYPCTQGCSLVENHKSLKRLAISQPLTSINYMRKAGWKWSESMGEESEGKEGRQCWWLIRARTGEKPV